MRLEYAKNPRWASAAKDAIDMTIKWDGFPEELPFTAKPDDAEEHGRLLYAAALAGDFGVVQDPLPDLSDSPEFVQAWRETAEVSRFQARMALRNFGLFSAVDGYMKQPDTPVLYVEAWENAQTFRRMSPTVLAFKPLLGLTDEQLDELFRAAQEIVA